MGVRMSRVPNLDPVTSSAFIASVLESKRNFLLERSIACVFFRFFLVGIIAFPMRVPPMSSLPFIQPSSVSLVLHSIPYLLFSTLHSFALRSPFHR
ncbi:hypothetical protein DFH07DRAFT_35382 [Mycena maculata]|uniref:Transmembrane protein n=1 Tax=Mycena maculata TaxID=230809 RepID=A0AAD7IJM7_9AGAR|nr:hypothetical protein DFH07DRAFT_35382 [Mycena maculata]